MAPREGPVEGVAKGGDGAEEAAEIALIELGEGGVASGSAEAVVSRAVLFVGEIEEGFVASVVDLGDDDGAADAAGPVHLAVLRTVDAARIVGEGIGVEGFVANAGVGAAVEGVGAGLHDVVEDAALAAAEFGGHAPGLDFDFGEGFDGDGQGGEVAASVDGNGGTVDEGFIGEVGGAVDAAAKGVSSWTVSSQVKPMTTQRAT